MLGCDADSTIGARVPMYECEHCRLKQTDLSKVKEHFDQRYFDGYYGEAAQGEFSLLIWLFQKERRWRALKGRARGRVLDVGCGDGTFLKGLGPSFEKLGFEPSKSGSESLRRAQIQAVDLSAPTPPLQHQIDLITLWHSLEHVEEPQETLRSLLPFLAAHSEVYISVPNIESWQARLFRAHWFHLDPTRHLLHFTPATLRSLLASTGYDVLEVSTFSWEYNVFGWWQSILNFLPAPFNWAYKRLKRKLPLERGFGPRLHWFLYIAVGVLLLPVAGCMALLEGAVGAGGVVNIRAKPRR